MKNATIETQQGVQNTLDTINVIEHFRSTDGFSDAQAAVIAAENALCLAIFKYGTYTRGRKNICNGITKLLSFDLSKIEHARYVAHQFFIDQDDGKDKHDAANWVAGAMNSLAELSISEQGPSEIYGGFYSDGMKEIFSASWDLFQAVLELPENER